MSNANNVTTRRIPLGEILAGKSFKSFDKIRRLTNKIVKPYRDDWLMAVLIKNSVFVNPNVMPKREIVEIYEKHQISLIDESGIYRIYRGDEIIGEWDNSKKIRINKDGKIEVIIKYSIM